MTGEKLLLAVGAVDPALAEDAHNPAPRRMARRVAVALIAAALALALAAVTAAAYYSDGLLDYFAWRNGGALSEQQLAAIQALTAVVDQSRTADGWTVTVDRALAARHNAYIKLDVTAPAGTVLDPERQGLDLDVTISGFNTPDVSDEGVTGYGWQMEMFKEAGMAENEAMVLLALDCTATAASGLDLGDGAMRSVTIENLRLRQLGGHDQTQTLVKGPWRFTFALPAAAEIELLDGTVSVPVWETAAGEREDVELLSFRLTALGATCEYETAHDHFQEFDGMTVIMADGAAVTGQVQENSARDFGKVCSFVFDTPIDLSRAVSVSFQGLELPVPEVDEHGK